MNSNVKYFAGVIGIILVAIIAILAITNRGSGPSTQTTGAPRMNQYANRDSSVSLTTQGQVVGDDKFRSIRITITPELRQIDILTGYDNTIQHSQTYPNTTAAYETFLDALDRAGFNRSKKSLLTDYKGVCPLGKRYLYGLINDGDKVVNTWSTSCSTADGTFAGQAPLIRSLFQGQVTDYNTQVSNVQL